MCKILCKVMFIITVLATVVFVGFMIYMAIYGLWVHLISLVSSTLLMWIGFIDGGLFDKIFVKEVENGSTNI